MPGHAPILHFLSYWEIVQGSDRHPPLILGHIANLVLPRGSGHSPPIHNLYTPTFLKDWQLDLFFFRSLSYATTLISWGSPAGYTFLQGQHFSLQTRHKGWKHSVGVRVVFLCLSDTGKVGGKPGARATWLSSLPCFVLLLFLMLGFSLDFCLWCRTVAFDSICAHTL